MLIRRKFIWFSLGLILLGAARLLFTVPAPTAGTDRPNANNNKVEKNSTRKPSGPAPEDGTIPQVAPEHPPPKTAGHTFPARKYSRRWSWVLQLLLPFRPGFCGADYCTGIIFHGTAVGLPLWNPAMADVLPVRINLVDCPSAVRPMPARGSGGCSR